MVQAARVSAPRIAPKPPTKLGKAARLTIPTLIMAGIILPIANFLVNHGRPDLAIAVLGFFTTAGIGIGSLMNRNVQTSYDLALSEAKRPFSDKIESKMGKLRGLKKNNTYLSAEKIRIQADLKGELTDEIKASHENRLPQVEGLIEKNNIAITRLESEIVTSEQIVPGDIISETDTITVYAAYSIALNKPINIIRVNKDNQERLRDATGLLRSLYNSIFENSPFVRVFGVKKGLRDLAGESFEGTLTESLDGRSLADEIAQHPGLSVNNLKLAIKLAEAVQRVHAGFDAPIIIRNLDPNSIVITRPIEDDTVRILCFDLVRKEVLTSAGAPGQGAVSMFGITVPVRIKPKTIYDAPEIDNNISSRASDVYSLGVALHQLFLGQEPGKSNILSKVQISELKNLLTNMLAVNVADRPEIDAVVGTLSEIFRVHAQAITQCSMQFASLALMQTADKA